MLSINAQVLEKNGKKEFVILPYEEFLRIQEELESYEDLRMLRKAKKEEKDSPTISIDEARKILNI